jgi:hypothetical protein
MESQIWWEDLEGSDLSQGDYLVACPVLIVLDSFDPIEGKESDVIIEERNLIIMTQSCDLIQNKAKSVALCPIYTLDELTKKNPSYSSKKSWEPVRQGRIEGWHMLAGFLGPSNQDALVVDFRQIYTLPVGFLRNFATKANVRKRLKSPYLEHTAQSFARFFMRVGLPSNIEQFK